MRKKIDDLVRIDIRQTSLEEMLFCIGGTIFSNTTSLQDINSNVLGRLSELIQDELTIRKKSKNKREELFIISSFGFGDYND